MKKMKIKICGLTNEEDAKMALDLGATHLGFVMAKSPREVKPSLVRSILKNLSSQVFSIGVFVESSSEKILEVVEETGMRGIQLYSQKSEKIFLEIREKNPSLYLIKAQEFSVEKNILFKEESVSDAFLIEAKSERTSKRKSFSSNVIDSSFPFFLAGGINLENIRFLIEKFSPFGIDISSGLEKEFRKKDPEKMKIFFKTIRNLL